MDTREQLLEKMRNGQPVRVIDDLSLFEDMMACAEKCHAMNQIRPTQWDEKREAMRDLLGSMGERLTIFLPFYAQNGTNITVGDDVTFNRGVTVLDMGQVTFGNNVMVGPNCSFFAGNHALDPEERKNMICLAGPITVGDDVWIGGHCVITAGVTIGAGAVIGAGSVVTKDVPPMCIAAGNPCRVIREIGPQDKLMDTEDQEER
ncbi:MAG: sugar O-acetyltransferase [Propionibacteriaceae bacterium]|nr:sugar O-acetyltransferase [Propionibacteriaceae bacterium]